MFETKQSEDPRCLKDVNLQLELVIQRVLALSCQRYTQQLAKFIRLAVQTEIDASKLLSITPAIENILIEMTAEKPKQFDSFVKLSQSAIKLIFTKYQLVQQQSLSPSEAYGQKFD